MTAYSEGAVLSVRLFFAQQPEEDKMDYVGKDDGGAVFVFAEADAESEQVGRYRGEGREGVRGGGMFKVPCTAALLK